MTHFDIICRAYSYGTLTFEKFKEKLDKISLVCEFCKQDDFVDREELVEHQEEEHEYEMALNYHDQNCCYFDMTYSGGLGKCKNCGFESSKD